MDFLKKLSFSQLPPQALIYLFIIVAALLSGLSDNTTIHAVATAISDIFIKIFKCISLPIIALSIIVTLSHYSTDAVMKRIWQKTIFYTISTTVVAAAVALVLYLIIKPQNIVSNSAQALAAPSSATQGNYLSYLANLIPANIFSPFLEHQVIGALFVSIVVGIAIRFIEDKEAKDTIINFFKGAHAFFLVITGWVVNIIPIALYGFITTTVMQLKNGLAMGGLGRYLLVIVLANLIQGFIILPLLLWAKGINPYKAFVGMFPALSVAFFSKSSVGALPVTIASAENNLGIDKKVSRFVLPLCTSINMNGCAAFIFTTVIFLMQNNGATITIPTMLLWIVISTIAAVGNAGVPMGCFFLSASLLTSMNVPITLLGLILPFYSLIDMVETALNVWSDACVAQVIDKEAKEIPTSDPQVV